MVYYIGFFGAKLGCVPCGGEGKRVICSFSERPRWCTILCFLGRGLGVFRVEANNKRWLVRSQRGPVGVLYRVFLPRFGCIACGGGSKRWFVRSRGGPAGVLYKGFFGRYLGVFRVELNKKGGLFVPGEAPLVYYVMFFWARLGCIPWGGEQKRWLVRSRGGPIGVL